MRGVTVGIIPFVQEEGSRIRKLP